MEVYLPFQIPDATARGIVSAELENMFVQFSNAHGDCLDGKPSRLFSSDPEEEQKILEELCRALNLIHGFYLDESTAFVEKVTAEILRDNYGVVVDKQSRLEKGLEPVDDPWEGKS